MDWAHWLRRAALAGRSIKHEAREGLGRFTPGALRAYRLTGEVSPHGTQLTALFVGRRYLAEDLRSVLFPGESAMRDEGPASALTPWATADDLRTHGDDLAVVDDGIRVSSPTRGPVRLSMTLNAELDLNTADPLSAASPSHRRALNRARELRLTFRRGRARSELRAFQEQLLNPSILARHGTRAFVDSLQTLERLWDQCELYFLERDGRTLGGYLYLVDRLRRVGEYWRTATLPELWADPKRVHAVSMLMCEHALERTRALGLPTFSLGLTPPVPTNGLFQFKRRWGCTFRPSASQPLCGLEFWSARKEAFLRERGLLVIQDGNLVALSGFDTPPDPAQALRALSTAVNELWFAGLSQVRVTATNRPVLEALLPKLTGAHLRGRVLLE